MTWRDELADVHGKLSDPIEGDPLNVNAYWEYDISYATDICCVTKHRHTGWQTVAIRHFADESLEDCSPPRIDGRSA